MHVETLGASKTTVSLFLSPPFSRLHVFPSLSTPIRLFLFAFYSSLSLSLPYYKYFQYFRNQIPRNPFFSVHHSVTSDKGPSATILSLSRHKNLRKGKTCWECLEGKGANCLFESLLLPQGNVGLLAWTHERRNDSFDGGQNSLKSFHLFHIIKFLPFYLTLDISNI